MIAGARLASRRALAAWIVAASMLASVSVVARDAPPLAEVRASTLPAEARDVLARIHAGGPFRYDRDGVVFGNFEKLLPIRPRGYYHEYTVRTPGARNRAARRIVCGGPKEAPDACFYSDDHYASFRRIAE